MKSSKSEEWKVTEGGDSYVDLYFFVNWLVLKYKNSLLGISEKDVDLDGAIKACVFERDLKELDNGLETIIYY